mmetsp:Transcript_92285/g.270121  ORF Transcript_92285/g.270121 Transcript_92285/m.270121 type:complete len:243 (+) Transcript_92285:1531-2259(+)
MDRERLLVLPDDPLTAVRALCREKLLGYTVVALVLTGPATPITALGRGTWHERPPRSLETARRHTEALTTCELGAICGGRDWSPSADTAAIGDKGKDHRGGKLVHADPRANEAPCITAGVGDRGTLLQVPTVVAPYDKVVLPLLRNSEVQGGATCEELRADGCRGMDPECRHRCPIAARQSAMFHSVVAVVVAAVCPACATIVSHRDQRHIAERRRLYVAHVTLCGPRARKCSRGRCGYLRL